MAQPLSSNWIDLDVGEQPSMDKQNHSQCFDSVFPASSALELRPCTVSDPPLWWRNPSPQASASIVAKKAPDSSPSLTRRILNLWGFTFTATICIILFALFLRPVLAQAPANDIISWPSSLLLLASILYAGLGTEPSIGIFLGRGLPIFSLKAMRRVKWVSNACHFLSDIRSMHGKSNFWIRSNEITVVARAEALKKTNSVLHPVTYKHLAMPLDKSLWRLMSEGLIIPAIWTPITPSSLSIKPNFLLFAAADYHVFRDWMVNMYQGDEPQFSMLWMPHSSVIDVDSEDKALAVVAAHMNEGSTDEGPWKLNLVGVNLDGPICAINFHSYSSTSAKVSTSLNELAHAYYRVVQHIKQQAIAFDALNSGQLATVNVGQSLWIAILGGELLDKGRVTFQNLPGSGSWAIKDTSAGEAYLDRVQAVLEAIEPYANTPKFFDLVFSSGTSRWPTYAFLFAGLCRQMIICYFLSIGTSAGIWTSVTLANSLYSGRLTDWHTMFFGRTPRTSELGMKMLVPDAGSKELMVVATFDRSSPCAPQGLTPGLFLNGFGLLAAILGAIFQEQTRNTLGFRPTVPTATWVIYTSIALSLGIEGLTRWAIYSTVFPSLIICTLAAFFAHCCLGHLWPILDALTWLSGLPLGIIENGRMILIDDNYLHLVLVN
ncbi:hypothetical protein BS47DRAFT_1349598 [Hydnum rufescens UP504]|uniref:Uncharacterized protein n=1 Tax=Hydnum rufescens UP504 TaxID=1448309 RepID=A0A9P6DPM5_9AGAM|nr:hypothetical protein BS47DRAFT_1349598 [Hydnum rufescens UP504]